MKVLLFQLDGKIPNIALMRIAAHHRAKGDEVDFRWGLTSEACSPDLLDRPDKVYASTIFEKTRQVTERLLQTYPEAVVGGTGWNIASSLEAVGIETEKQDYSIYPQWKQSIGFTQRGCRLKCPFCLTPDSLVITGDGPKPISSIVPGELVLTHKGRYRKVKEILSRPYDGDVIELRSGALSTLFPTRVTPEHPIWTRHVSYRSGGQRLTRFGWKNAGDLILKDRQANRSREVFAYPRTVDTNGLLEKPWPLTLDLARVIGWYIAEGYASKTQERGYHKTTFCLGFSDREMSYAQEIERSAKALGLKSHIYSLKIGIRVCIDRVAITRWLVEQFGTGASTKRIPLWVRLMPHDFLETLLNAWACGDGWYHVKKGTPTWKITTSCSFLALAAYEIALKLGYTATINKHHVSDVIQGRKVNVKPAFTVLYHSASRAKHSVVGDQEYIYRKFEQPIHSHYAGSVFNLEVEEDNSYCTPAFAIHNCVVPTKEGAVKEISTIPEIWRGDPWPRELILLDNDFFGQPRWSERIDEIRKGNFKVSFNQGINARFLNDESAAAIASVDYRDDQMKTKRIYTAWDNKKDEKRLMQGLEALVKHGVKPDNIMVYILLGYWKWSDLADWEHRRKKLREFGCRPYPMPYERTPEAVGFQRWVIGAYDKRVSWETWKAAGYEPRNIGIKDDAQMELP